MEAKAWKTAIKRRLKQKNIDPKAYSSLVDTLADILHERDAVYEQYVEDGARPVIEYTNKAGATNSSKNPLLILWNDLNASALTYWRELGLTPSAYRKMSGEKTGEKAKGSALVEALKGL